MSADVENTFVCIDCPTSRGLATQSLKLDLAKIVFATMTILDLVHESWTAWNSTQQQQKQNYYNWQHLTLATFWVLNIQYIYLKDCVHKEYWSVTMTNNFVKQKCLDTMKF